MAVRELADRAAIALLDALHALRDTPAPVGTAALRLSVLAHATTQLQGVYLRELAAAGPLAAEHGCRGTADLLVTQAELPVWQARRDAALATRLALLPGLPDALADGRLTVEAGQLLVRAWRALPPRLRDEPLAEAMLTLGELLDLRDLRGKVDELLGALVPEVTDEDLAQARRDAHLTLVDVGARTRWSGETDALTGELVRQVLHARAEADRAQADGDTPAAGPRSTAGRHMDALVGLLTSAPAAGSPVPASLVLVTTVDDLARSADPRPVLPDVEGAVHALFEGTGLHADGDLPDDGDPGFADDDLGSAAAGTGAAPPRPRWTTCTRGGTPVGPRTLAALACGGRVSRLVLSPLGSPVDSSPWARQLTERERRALEHRAGYRCERLGCGRAAHTCVPHHVVPWGLGGPSTLANAVLLCVSCHHLLHDRQRVLDLTGRRAIGPRGWVEAGDLFRPGP